MLSSLLGRAPPPTSAVDNSGIGDSDADGGATREDEGGRAEGRLAALSKTETAADIPGPAATKSGGDAPPPPPAAPEAPPSPRSCVRAHSRAALRRGALRATAEDVRADLSRERGDDAESVGDGGERLGDSVRAALRDRCTFVGGDGAVTAAKFKASAEIDPSDTILVLRGRPPANAAGAVSSLTAKLSSLTLGGGPSEKVGAGAAGGAVGQADAEMTAAAARCLGDALRRRLGLGSGSASAVAAGGPDSGVAEAGKAAARSIAASSRLAASEGDGTTAITNAATESEAVAATAAGGRGAASRALSAAASAALSVGSLSLRLASGAAWGAAGAAAFVVRSAVGEYGAADFCAEEYGTSKGEDVGFESDEDDGRLAEDAALGDLGEADDLAGAPSARSSASASGAGSASVLGLSDEAISVSAVVDCCAALLRFSESAIDSSGEHLDDGGDGTALLLGRFEDGPRSLRELCRAAGRDEAARSAASGDDAAARLGGALSRLGAADVDLLALTLLSSGHAAVSERGDVIALRPSGARTAAALDEVDVALFKLRASAEALEVRMERLKGQADEAGRRAVEARRGGGKGLAAARMRRRRLILEELDRCSAALLNLEAAAGGVRGARTDAGVVECYDMARRAMRTLRAKGGEGSLGLTVERAEEAVDGLAEEIDELRALGDAVEGVGIGAEGVGGWPPGAGDLDEEELLAEFEALEQEIATEDIEAAVDEVDESNVPTAEHGLDPDVVHNPDRGNLMDVALEAHPMDQNEVNLDTEKQKRSKKLQL